MKTEGTVGERSRGLLLSCAPLGSEAWGHSTPSLFSSQQVPAGSESRHQPPSPFRFTQRGRYSQGTVTEGTRWFTESLEATFTAALPSPPTPVSTGARVLGQAKPMLREEPTPSLKPPCQVQVRLPPFTACGATHLGASVSLRAKMAKLVLACRSCARPRLNGGTCT